MTRPLHPRGTVKARFEPPGTSELFRKLGVGARSCDLGDEGLYLSEELVQADVAWLGAGDHPEALAIVVLALMIVQRQGSTRLPLDPKGPLRGLVTDILRIAKLDADAPRVLKTIANLTAAPRFNSVIGSGDSRLPLVVDDDCLYTERSRWLEERVARRLRERLAAPPRDAAGIVEDLLARTGARALSTEQAEAIRLALSGALAVITGGPGTGKTLVASAIVRGLRRQGVSQIALAAQTGKAANRLTQVIAEQLAALARDGRRDELSAADRGLAAAPPVAQTLHRLLGYSGRRFAHHALSPLPAGAVIIDEASMVDLELMHALLEALPLSAPLILIGDANQLPAIDAGQILADLAPRPATRVAVLSTSYRMDTSDAAGRLVYEASQQVRAGELSRLLEARRTSGTLAFAGAEWVDTATKDRRPDDITLAVVEATWHHYDGPRALRAAERVFRFVDGTVHADDEHDLEALWAMLERGRILTVTRALATGAIAINAHLHDKALEGLSVAGRPELVPGEPVMVTANDYHRGLFNGDQGIVVRADEGLGRHHYRAVFRCQGALRPFAIEALRDRLELSWALTVHKSQGSELDGVTLVLPHEPLPLVTRELLYTGITRARRSVVVAGSRAVLSSGLKAVAQRHSGLSTRLGRENA